MASNYKFVPEAGEEILWRGKPDFFNGWLEAFVDFCKAFGVVFLLLGLIGGVMWGNPLVIAPVFFLLAPAVFALIDAITDLGLSYIVTNKRIVVLGWRAGEVYFSEIGSVKHGRLNDCGFFVFLRRGSGVGLSLMAIPDLSRMLSVLPEGVREAAAQSAKGFFNLPVTVSPFITKSNF